PGCSCTAATDQGNVCTSGFSGTNCPSDTGCPAGQACFDGGCFTLCGVPTTTTTTTSTTTTTTTTPTTTAAPLGPGQEPVHGGCFTTCNAGAEVCAFACGECVGSVGGSGNFLCGNFVATTCTSNADCPVGQACQSSESRCLEPC